MSQRRITTELTKLKNDPDSKITVEPIADEIFHLRGSFNGPEGTPYEGGLFVVDMRLPYDYPLKPPECTFSTRIYHPNVGSRGEVCLDILKRGWNPGQSIANVLNTLLGLLKTPDSENPLQAEIAIQYNNDRAGFDKIAREWTLQHAIAK
jgi:ubiquitin-conjugating enzyme (huntingtin interacting protein 2)